jgi:hypothetical protein
LTGLLGASPLTHALDGSVSVAGAFLLAQDQQNVGPEFGKASPVGLIVMLLLLGGTVFLIRSMNKHLRRLPESFEPEHPEADQLADDGTDRGGVQPPASGSRHSRPAGNGTTAGTAP